MGRGTRGLLQAATLGAMVIHASPLFAQPQSAVKVSVAPASPPLEDAAPLADTPQAKKKKKKDKDKNKSKVKLSGRVLVGTTTTRQVAGDLVFWRSKQELNSARVGLEYKYSKDLKGVIKLEAGSGKASIRDGYLRLRLASGLKLQAGRYKRPISSIALAGKSDLPAIERGLLDALELPFTGGRGQGIGVTYKFASPLKPSVSLSIFQDEVHADTLDASEKFAQDVYVRVSFEPIKDLSVSSSFAWMGYQREPTVQDSYRHGPMGSLELAYEGPALRAWVEGFTGRNITPLLDAPSEGRFLAIRGIVAPRFATGVPRRLVPFVGASFYDRKSSVSKDADIEGQVGVSVEFTKVWRIQLEVSHILPGEVSTAIEGTAFRLQLGAKFKE